MTSRYGDAESGLGEALCRSAAIRTWGVLGVAATALMIASMGWITRGALRRAVEQSSSSSDNSAGAERLSEAPAG